MSDTVPNGGAAAATVERSVDRIGAPPLAPMRFNGRGFRTLLRREIARFLSVPAQTIASPIITTGLYFLVFGYSLGSRVREMGGIPYMQFILPGLVMLGVIGNSFLNTSSSLFGAKINGTIVDVLVAPLSAAEIVGAMLLATLARAFLVGGATWAIGALFVGPQLAHPGALLLFLVLVSVTMGSFGLLVAIHAQKFEQLSAPPTYLLTPLTYLGGVFYTLDTLPAPWHAVSLANPIVYMVNGLRWGMTGVSDVPIGRAVALSALAAVTLATTAWWLVRAGTGLRN